MRNHNIPATVALFQLQINSLVSKVFFASFCAIQIHNIAMLWGGGDTVVWWMRVTVAIVAPQHNRPRRDQ